MSQFRENLVYLRDLHSMTQEQLAMLVGVSRQSVQKWEAGKSTPDLEKLQKLCSIFDVSIDDLIRGDVHDHQVSKFASPADAAVADTCGYADHCARYARLQALGIALCIGSLGAALLIGGTSLTISETPLIFLVPLFVGTLAALFIWIRAHMERSYFAKQHPFVENFYSNDEVYQAKHTLMRYQFGGIAGCVAAVLVLIGIQTMPQTPVVPLHPFVLMPLALNNVSLLGPGLFLVIVAVSVAALVYAGLSAQGLDVDRYNLERALGEDLYEERAARSGLTKDEFLAHKNAQRICSIIMAVATIVGVSWLFIGETLAPSIAVRVPFWMAWVIGGIACWIVGVVYGAKK